MNSCVSNIELSSWLPQRDELDSLLRQAGCPLPVHYVAFREAPPCNYSILHSRVVTHDGLFNSAFFHLDMRYDPYLSDTVRNRARVLFGHQANGMGRFSSYGLVAEALFKFSTQIYSHVTDVLQASQVLPTTLRISMYMGTSNPSINRVVDSRSLRALAQLRNKQSHSPCVIFAAPQDKIARLQIGLTSARSDCKVLTFNVSDGYTKADELVEAADIHLLAHGDYFIGSSDSAVSLFIANYVAWRRDAHDRRGNALIWLQTNDDRDIKYNNFSTYNCDRFENQLIRGK